MAGVLSAVLAVLAWATRSAQRRRRQTSDGPARGSQRASGVGETCVLRNHLEQGVRRQDGKSTVGRYLTMKSSVEPMNKLAYN